MASNVHGGDPERAFAGRAHARAYPSAKRAAALHGHTPWTEYDHRRSGSPELRYFVHAKPFVLEAFLVTLKAMNDLSDWPPEKLADREKSIDAEIARAYAETVRLTHTPDASAAERMDADQKLMELLAQRSAIRMQAEKKRRAERGH